MVLYSSVFLYTCYIFIAIFSFFFFLTIRPPPSSTLFPYTTLFRSLGLGLSQLSHHGMGSEQQDGGQGGADQVAVLLRSEEHTSELQSLRHLVCRLLLEKKKKKKHHTRQVM